GFGMAQVANMLIGQAGRMVVDRTNLAGNWQFVLTFAPEGATDSNAPSFFTALQEQLGLKLEPARVPVEVTVIDSAEHPTEDEYLSVRRIGNLVIGACLASSVGVIAAQQQPGDSFEVASVKQNKSGDRGGMLRI